jgi:hypothetical protein
MQADIISRQNGGACWVKSKLWIVITSFTKAGLLEVLMMLAIEAAIEGTATNIRLCR